MRDHRRTAPKLKRSHAAAARAALAAVLLSANAPADEPAAGIETMVVTEHAPAARLAELAATPGGVTLIDGDELRERNAASLADLLRYTPGVWSTSDTGNDNIFFSSRGSNLDAVDYDMNGIKLLQDGLPVTAADGNNHNRVIDPLSARFATVARGANALIYGASTLGGAVDFVSPTARGGAGREVLVNGGSHGHAQLRGTLGGMLTERADALITLERKDWDGYRDHNRQQRAGIYANVGWQLADNAETRLFATYIENDQQLAGALTRAELDSDASLANPSAVSGNFALNVDALRLASKTRLDLDDRRSLELGVSYEQQALFHPIVDRIMVPIGGVPTEVFSLLIDTEQRDVGGMLRYRQRAGDHDLVLGLNYGRNAVEGGNYRNLGGRPNGLTTSIDNAARSLELYAIDRWKLSPAWLVELAAQAVSADRDIHNAAAASGLLRNPKGSYSRVNPRIGVIRTLGDEVDLFANLSSLYEPPTNFQLEDEASGSGAILDAMHGTVLELGLRGRQPLPRDGSLAWDVALYYAEIRDEILSVDDPGAPGTSMTTNIARTVHSGLEAVLRAELAAGPRGGTITPLASVTINEFSFDRDPVYGSRKLPAAPGYVVRGEVLYRHPNGFFVGPTFDVVDSRFADFMNTYRVDSYRLLGLRAGWSDARWRVFGEIRNAADELYVASHGVLEAAAPDAAILYPGEPRSAYFGVQLRF